MAQHAKAPHQDSPVGLALVTGAGLGTVFGLLVRGGEGIAIGAGVGAAIGILVGAVWDGMRSKT